MIANKTLGVILAGGLSRRMKGHEKTLLDLAGKPLIEHAILRLTPQVNEIVINANGDPKRFSNFGVPIISDIIHGNPGPLAGVLAGLVWAKEKGYHNIVTVAGDTPFFPSHLVKHLKSTAMTEDAQICLAATTVSKKGLMRHPTFGLWPVDLSDNLHQAILDGIHKVVVWTDRHRHAIATFETETIDPFFNINHPEDLELAETIVSELNQ